MERYKKLIQGYERQQTRLRARISSLKAGRVAKGDKLAGEDPVVTIRRTERQIVDLERAIAKCREMEQASKLI